MLGMLMTVSLSESEMKGFNEDSQEVHYRTRLYRENQNSGSR